MKKQNSKRKILNAKNNKGITLIALVITIVVLLILAMVSIRLVTNGGILTKAELATSKYKIEEEKEKITLAYNSYKLDKITNKNATLTVEGATVESLGSTLGWNIKYNDTQNTYSLGYEGEQEKVQTVDELADNTLVKMYLSGELKQGDYLEYTPDINLDGHTINGEDSGTQDNYSYTIAQENLKWRILGYDEIRNQILLISENATSIDNAIRFWGVGGYRNYERVLHETNQKLYSKNGIGIARSLNLKDIDTYMFDIDATRESFTEGSYTYGESREYTNIYHPDQWDGRWSGTITGTSFLMKYENVTEDPIKLELFTGKSFTSAILTAIADKAIFLNDSAITYCLGNIDFSYIDLLYVYTCEAYDHGNYIDGVNQDFNMRPVVALDSNVTIEQVPKLVTE